MPDFGSMAYQNADDVSITGGSISGLRSFVILGAGGVATFGMGLSTTFQMTTYDDTGSADIACDDVYFKNHSGSQTRVRINNEEVGVFKRLDVSKTIRSTGTSDATNGSGVELLFYGGSGHIFSYDRGESAWLPLVVSGLATIFAVEGVSKFVLNNMYGSYASNAAAAAAGVPVDSLFLQNGALMVRQAI